MAKVLVGVHAPSAVLGWAGDVARRSGAELTVARVFERGQAELAPDDLESDESTQRTELAEWCQALPDSDPTPDLVLLKGDPADALLADAAERGVDLLVVGVDDEPRIPHFGGTSNHLVHHTTVPVAIVPASSSEPIAHLVVGVDGSDTSRAAVEGAAALAGPLGVGVTAVLAFEPFMEFVPRDDPSSWFSDSQRQMTEWTSPIAATGVDLEIDIQQEKHPVDALQRALEAHPGSTAIVGARGVGGFTGLRTGRVPLQLLQHSDRPVIVVPEVAT